MDQNKLPCETAFGQVRLARSEDVPQIVAMIEKLAEYHGDVPSLTAEVLQRDTFGPVPWCYVVVAEYERELIGYAALCGLMQLQFGVRGMDMHHLFVEENCRGHGVGGALVSASKVIARDLACRYMMVGTHPENTAAQVFYEALGFERRDAHPPRFSLRL